MQNNKTLFYSWTDFSYCMEYLPMLISWEQNFLLKFVGRVPTHKPFMAMMIGYCTNVSMTLDKRLRLAELSGEWPQNLLENWDGTRHLLDVSWSYGLKNIFFRNKTFLFFKIESWNFQVQFEIKIRETSQNFNSFSSFRQLLFSFFLSVVWLSWNFVSFHEILFQTDAESFSFLSWKTKQFYSYFLGRSQYQNKKPLFTDPIFSNGFAINFLCTTKVNITHQVYRLPSNQYYS